MFSRYCSIQTTCSFLLLCSLTLFYPIIVCAEGELVLRKIEVSEVKEFKVSSQYGRSEADKKLYKSKNLQDGRLWTAWAEGSGQGGQEEWISYTFGAKRYISRVTIMPGNARDSKNFRQFLRPKTISLEYDDGSVEIHLQDIREEQHFDFKIPIQTHHLKFVFVETYKKGSRTKAVAISEVVLLESLDILALTPQLRQDIEEAIQNLGDPDDTKSIDTLCEVGGPALTWLFIALENENRLVRQRATEALVKMGDARAVSALLGVVKEDDPIIRIHAYQLFGKLKVREAVSHLIIISSDDQQERELRSQAIKTLGQIGDSKALTVFQNTLLGNDQVLAEQVAELFYLMGSEGFQILEEQVAHESPEVRRIVALAAGSYKNKSDYSILIQLASDEDLEVKLTSVSALAKTGNPIALPILVSLTQDSNPRVKKTIAESLGHFSTVEAVDVLEHLARDSDSYIRTPAISSLIRMDLLALPALERLLVSSSSSNRGEYLEGFRKISQQYPLEVVMVLEPYLSKTGDLLGLEVARTLVTILPEGLTALIEALRSQNSQAWFTSFEAMAIGGPEVSNVIVEIFPVLTDDEVLRFIPLLTKLKNPKSAQLLIKRYGSSNSVVRSEAISALKSFPDNNIRQTIILALEDHDVEVRRQAMVVSGELKIKEAIPSLTNRLELEQDYKAPILITLGAIGDPEAIPAILPYLQHPSSTVRERATEALGMLGDSNVVPYLMEALNDEDAMVRASAITALGRLE